MRKRNQRYNNQKTVIAGITFDSIKESKMYLKLKDMEASGKIKDLELKPEYELLARFELIKKGKLRVHRPIRYTPDFRFYDNDQERIRVLDAKGHRDHTYLIKKKLFDWKYLEEKIYIEEVL